MDQLKLKNYNKKDNVKINNTLKIISPKIEIDRFFENEDSSKNTQ